MRLDGRGRASRDEMMMGIADAVSWRSTCDRLSVGAVISRDGRVISTGYNGTPAGMEHCNHFAMNDMNPCRQAVHAEANALIFAARHGVATSGAELHSTHLPCLDCSKLIINAGIVRVGFGHDYRDHAGLELLNAAGLLTIWM